MVAIPFAIHYQTLVNSSTEDENNAMVARIEQLTMRIAMVLKILTTQSDPAEAAMLATRELVKK